MNDAQLAFMDDCVIKDFEHRKENEEFPESTIFMLENLNFKPDEYGFVEPDKPPEEPKPSEEELKRQAEEEKAKEAAAQAAAKGGKAAPAKAAPADKKKAEEEAAKKKAEEEAALKKMLEEQSRNRMTDEERMEQQRQKEEAERKKREMEYFDLKTTQRYKENLGKYGDIYVCDAPLATLSASNSIAEIRCPRKVMGVRITEELRKLSQFFLKKHPNEIKSRGYVPPMAMDYHNNPFECFIGGTVRSVQDILDKILLVNSLLDTASFFNFYGEFALAALHALGINIGRTEREGATKDFEATKDFFMTLFVKAVKMKKDIRLPYSFLVSPKIELDDYDLVGSQQNTMGEGTGNKTHVEKTQ